MTLTTVATLAARYDAFLVDQFGVLMSGDGPYPGAAAALNTLASTKKPVI
ncbi:MAG: TIGR01459 family HAD-type hydrolase, partial [Pseudomonadota bacterium]